MKTVKFNVDFNGQLPQFKGIKAGTVMEVSDGHALALIHRQVVSEVGKEKAEPVRPEPIEQKEEKVVLKTKEEKAVKKISKK